MLVRNRGFRGPEDFLTLVRPTVPPAYNPVPADATRVAMPSGNRVASLDESRLAQKIYDQHQDLKLLAKHRQISPDMLKRAQEFAKFLTYYVAAYSPPYGKLRADVAQNLMLVVRETPGLQSGLGIAPLVLWGIVVTVGGVLGVGTIALGWKEANVQQSEIDARKAAMMAGKTPAEIEQMFGKPGASKSPSLASSIGDIAQYAMWGTLLYFGWQLFGDKLKGKLG